MILYGYFIEDSLWIGPIICDHAMFMEPFVFTELFFLSEVYRNISRRYVLESKAGDIISFPGDQKVRASISPPTPQKCWDSISTLHVS
jgi:hypothetical protein